MESSDARFSAITEYIKILEERIKSLERYVYRLQLSEMINKQDVTLKDGQKYVKDSNHYLTG